MTGRADWPPGRLAEPMRFRHTFRCVPAPVAVVLTRDASGGIRGLTCTSATSLSAEPPMVLVCMDDRTGMAALIESCGWFSVNFLAAGRADLARAFATSGAALQHVAAAIVDGRTGTPVLGTGTSAVTECRVAAVHRGGDHSVVHGLVHHARFQADVAALVYGAGRYGEFTADSDPRLPGGRCQASRRGSGTAARSLDPTRSGPARRPAAAGPPGQARP